jgi:long-chain acyl-CoA synthetase
MRSVPVADDESHRVDPRYKHKLAATPRDGVETLYDLAKDAFARYGTRRCMGTRQFLGWKVPGKVKNFGDGIHWLTFSEVGVMAHKFGAACRSAGMQPAPYTTTLEAVKSPCRVAIFENTCGDWMVAAIGCFTQSITVTTVYATLGMDAVVEAVVDNSIPLIVCNKSQVKKLLEKASKMPTLTHIVYTSDLVAPDDAITLPAKQGKVKIIPFEDFCVSGDTKAYPPTPPKADTCAVVMYTSGSTGKPKGVIITHRQYVLLSLSCPAER